MATNLNYSRLGKIGSEAYKSWNHIILSSTTVAKRNQLKSSMDDFTSFTWRGVNAFDVFGAFIINNKNTLKFYNGPSFSNEYTKPQFESAAGQLVGVSFNVQKIDFTIGVYWINEDDYRKLIDWLDPYEISDLTFGFEPNYYYLVKLASIGDSIRHIVGIEGSGDEKQYMYYTELKLTFEVQGDPCAYRNIAYEFLGTADQYNTDIEHNDGNRSFKYTFQLKDKQTVPDNDFISHLAMPFKYKMHLKLNWNQQESSTDNTLSLECNTRYKVSTPDATEEWFSDTRLFNLILKNLSYTDLIQDYNGDYYLDIVYDSSTGLLYWDRNDAKLFLLSRLSTASSGSRIVDYLESTSYKVLGTFNDWDFDLTKWQIELKVYSSIPIEEPFTQSNSNVSENNYYIEMRARTNLI